jgi:hypothetical protein
VSNYTDKVKRFEEELLEGYADPGDLVNLSLSPQFAASMGQQTHGVLISCAAALTRFAAHIQFFGNKARAEVTHLRRTLEYTKAKTIGGLDFNARDTDKAKAAAAYKNNPDLERLDKSLAEAEQRSIYYEKMPDVILDLVNVIKYEIRRKEQEKEKGRF